MGSWRSCLPCCIPAKSSARSEHDVNQTEVNQERNLPTGETHKPTADARKTIRDRKICENYGTVGQNGVNQDRPGFERAGVGATPEPTAELACACGPTDGVNSLTSPADSAASCPHRLPASSTDHTACPNGVASCSSSASPTDPALAWPRGVPWDGTPTVAGDAALRKGREMYRLGQKEIYQPFVTPGEITAIGGREGLIHVCSIHYRRMFEDPRMVVLFNHHDPDTNVSAVEHGKRLAYALLDMWLGGTEYDGTEYGHEYTKLRGTKPSHPLQSDTQQRAHERAKNSALRWRCLRGKGFTEDQRSSWLGHVWLAAEEAGVTRLLCDRLSSYLASIVEVYGPFAHEGPWAGSLYGPNLADEALDGGVAIA